VKNGNNPTYVPLSRGIREHLPTYSSNAFKVYLFLLTGAEHKSGPDYGTLWTTTKEICDGTGLSPNTVRASIRELTRGHVSLLSPSGKSADPFCSIIENDGDTRAKRIRFRIEKAKISARDFHKEVDPARARGELPDDADAADADDAEREVENLLDGFVDDVLKGKKRLL
jgi:hypothetical protein